MKNLKKLMFTFLFVVVSVFTMGKVKAASLTGDKIHKEYLPSTVAVTSGADKASVSVLSGNTWTSELQAKFDAAANSFYSGFDAFGATATEGYVKMIPMKVNVTENIGTGDVELYIKVPNDMMNVRTDSVTHLRFARLNEGTPGFTVVMGVPGAPEKYTWANDEHNSMAYTKGTLNGTTFTPDENGDNYVVIKTNFKDDTLSTTAAAQGDVLYYVLAICYDKTEQPSQPIQPSPENPKTLDGSNSMYIVLGVIGLIGVIGLGSKFAKSSK